MNPLWLALHLPALALEANAPLPSPVAVVEHGRILLGDAAACAAGIESGMGTAAARMLLPTLTLLARNAEREAAALHLLACWAGSLTPRVSLTPDTLLLEIGSCLRLFGGARKMADAACAGVSAQGFSRVIAGAPTPLGAHWLAQHGTAVLCRDGESLRRRLEALPVGLLPGKAAAALARFGAHCLGDVRRLPAAALGRRIGRETLQLMARAFGELPDPRVDFVFPERFVLTLPLPAAVDNAAALLFAARRLSSALAGWLAVRQAGVRGARLCLLHRQDETVLELRFADLTAAGDRFERVLREQLERLKLKAPVEALRLEACEVAALPGRSQTLFADTADAGEEAIGALLERFAARLGETQVYRLGVHDEHRPECATRPLSLFGKCAPGAPVAVPRPLWLLARPEALAEVGGRPQRHGPLQLLVGPERIEAGWWDSGEENGKSSGDIRRDYFVALSTDARWLWIYREYQLPGGWFLHGVFG